MKEKGSIQKESLPLISLALWESTTRRSKELNSGMTNILLREAESYLSEGMLVGRHFQDE